MQAAVTLIVVLVGALADNIDKVIDAAFTLVDSLVNALLQDDNLSKILNSAVRLVIEISTGLIANAPRLVPAAFQLIGGIVKGLWDNKGLVVDAIVKVCKAILLRHTLAVNRFCRTRQKSSRRLVERYQEHERLAYPKNQVSRFCRHGSDEIGARHTLTVDRFPRPDR